MGIVNIKDLEQSQILTIESMMNTLWGELNTCHISQVARVTIERALSDCERLFETVLEGSSSLSGMQSRLETIDRDLAKAVVMQAQEEIPKSEHTSDHYMSLQTLERTLNQGTLTPIKVRTEVKEIMHLYR